MYDNHAHQNKPPRLRLPTASSSSHPNAYSNQAGPSFASPSSLGAFLADGEATLDVIPTRAGRKLCVRHKQMANQNVNAKLQKSLDNLPTSERSAITLLWSTFSNAPHAKRKLILEGILTMCCFSQLSHLSDSLNEIIRIDPFSLLPREVNLRILGYLDAISLGRAAQVSKSWKALADDDLLWRRMCGQHIDRKCEKCGWGLPLLERRRLKVELKDRSPAAAVGVGGHEDGHDHGHDHGYGRGATKLVTRVEALGGKASNFRRALSGGTSCDPAPSSTWTTAAKRAAAENVDEGPSAAKMAKVESDSENEAPADVTNSGLTRETRLTRPWKMVYCERLVVERNWRKGRCLTKTLKGHTDGVMCLQYHTSLSNPSYPVLITGSYDRSVRVWNLDTGREVRCLTGHNRAVRALQFDQMLLFTGAMDGTVRMWNWRAGECLRVLEGHTDGVVSLNYNGYLLASGSADTTIQVWNFRSGTKFTLRGHDEWVNRVVLWDGKSNPGDIDPTQMPSFTRHRTSSSPAPGAISASTANPKEPEIDSGAMLFSASDDCTVKLWDLVNQTCIRTFEGHSAQIQSMRLYMVDLSNDEIAAQHDHSSSDRRAITPPRTNGLTTGNHVALSPSPPPAAVVELPPGFDPVAHRTTTHPIEPRIYVHPTPDERNKGKNVASKGVTSDDGRQRKPILTTGSLDGTVKLWDVDSGKEISTLFGHIEGVWDVDIDSLRLVSASHDRTIKVWNRESGDCVQTLVGHRGAVTSLQLSDDMIISGSDDGDVMVWSFAPSPNRPGNLGDGTPTVAAIY